MTDEHVERAYVFIKATIDSSDQIRNTLLKKTFVKLIDYIYGSYDLVAIIEANDINSVGKIILDEIRSLDGIIETMTYLRAHRSPHQVNTPTHDRP